MMKTLITLLFFLLSVCSINAQDATLRRTISPDKPMLIVHIDTWNNAISRSIRTSSVGTSQSNFGTLGLIRSARFEGLLHWRCHQPQKGVDKGRDKSARGTTSIL